VKGYPNARDCEHGRLRRSCETCELNACDRDLEAARIMARSLVSYIRKEIQSLKEHAQTLQEDFESVLAGEAGKHPWLVEPKSRMDGE
jgi:hypothetical protein